MRLGSNKSSAMEEAWALSSELAPTNVNASLLEGTGRKPAPDNAALLLKPGWLRGVLKGAR